MTDILKPKNRDEALDMVERLYYEKNRDHHSVKWFHDQIEDLEYFTESEIWELLESYH